MDNLPSSILNVLPNGKYHELAVKYAVNGGELQYFNGASWFPYSGAHPFSNNFSDWRIKPEVKKYRIAQMNYGTCSADCDKESADLEDSYAFVKWLTPWIEYEAGINVQLLNLNGNCKEFKEKK